MRPTVASLTITDDEPPTQQTRAGALDWGAIDTQLKKAKGKWATLGPWRGKSSAWAYAKKVANDKTALDAAHYELAAREHVFDDGVAGSILWLRYVGI